jgi:hypothetical protein
MAFGDFAADVFFADIFGARGADEFVVTGVFAGVDDAIPAFLDSRSRNR